MEKSLYVSIIYLGFFICCIVFSIIINLLLLRLTRTIGIKYSTDTTTRWSKVVKPAVGGISFFIIFLLSTVAYPFFFQDNSYFQNLSFIGVLLASTLAFLMGLYDDAFSTDPFIKAFTQITCGLILISTGTYIEFFNYAILNYILTLLWVVGLMNAINMLDNMDAITGSVSIMIILTIIVNHFFYRSFTNAELIPMIGVFASLLGFLYFNWHPSKMYMGDTGSQFLGAYLSAIGIIFFWNGKSNPNDSDIYRNALTAIIMFSIPIIDTTTVFYKRIKAGRSPFQGGKDHTTHHLCYIGLSDKQVALVIIGISLLSLIITNIMLIYIKNWNIYFTIIFSLYFVILFSVLFYIGNKNKKSYN